jgi:hypothetical protein
MVAERCTRAQKRLQILPILIGHLARRIRNAGNLIKIAAYSPELGHGSLELSELPVRNPRDTPQVRPKHNRGIRSGSHSSAGGALTQQHVVIGPQPHEQARVPRTGIHLRD